MNINEIIPEKILENLLIPQNLISTSNNDGLTVFEFQNDNAYAKISNTDTAKSFQLAYHVHSNSILEDFKEYCESLEDDIYVDACERFATEIKDLNELEDNITQEDVSIFKSIVSDLAKEKIEYYKQYII